jgi:hypothetical protein
MPSNFNSRMKSCHYFNYDQLKEKKTRVIQIGPISKSETTTVRQAIPGRTMLNSKCFLI